MGLSSEERVERIKRLSILEDAKSHDEGYKYAKEVLESEYGSKTWGTLEATIIAEVVRDYIKGEAEKHTPKDVAKKIYLVNNAFELLGHVDLEAGYKTSWIDGVRNCLIDALKHLSE